MNIFKYRPLALCCAFIICIYLICSFIPVFWSFHKTDGEEYTEFEIINITYQNDSIAFLDARAKDRLKYHLTVYSPDELRRGDIICGICSFMPIEKSEEFDYVRYYRSKGIGAEGEMTSPVKIGHKNNILRDTVDNARSYCINAFKKYTDDDTAALLSALSVGDKGSLDDSLRRDFARSGVSHMLAISGMHLSVIMGCITMFSDIFDLGRRFSGFLVCLLCFCFMLIAGMSSSVLRAGLMFIIMSIGDMFRRCSDSLTNLFLAVALILIFSASSVYDTGLILSFTATAGIIIIVGNYMRKTENIKDRGVSAKLLRCVTISLLTTVSAQAFSFLPLLVFFDSVSMITVISNIIISPLLTMLLFTIPLFLAVSYIPFAAMGVGFVMNIATDVIIYLVSRLSAIPNALVSLEYPFVPYTYIAIIVGIILAVIIRKRSAYLMPYICWFICFTVTFAGYNLSYGSSADLVFYSEAGSDALIMRNRQGSVYLDFGKGTRASEKRAFNVIETGVYSKELEYWVITHYTDNLINAASKYMDEVCVRNICIPEPCELLGEVAASELEYYASEKNVNLIYYEYGEMFTVNGIGITVGVPVAFEDSSVNIPSAHIVYGDRSIAYYGLGYFDYDEYEDKYDILYIGECGTKRKQKSSPIISTNRVIVAEGNDTSAENIIGERTHLNDDKTYIKLNIG